MPTKVILGILSALVFPMAAQAQTGKHISVGGAVAAHEFVDDRFSQGVGLTLLYRVSPTGTEEAGWSWGPSATLGFSRADFSPDVAGDQITLGKLQSIPVLVGFGPHYRHGKWWTGLSVNAGASFNHFSIDDAAKRAYEDRLGTTLESVETKNSFALQPGASVWYDLTYRLGLYGGVSYFYSRPKAEITAGGLTRSETWKMDYVGFAVGAVVGIF